MAGGKGPGVLSGVLGMAAYSAVIQGVVLGDIRGKLSIFIEGFLGRGFSGVLKPRIWRNILVWFGRDERFFNFHKSLLNADEKGKVRFLDTPVDT